MQITKFLAIVAVFTARACQAGIVIGTSQPDEETFHVVQDLDNIVTSCYKGQMNHGVGLAGNLPSTLIRRLTVQHSISVALIDNIRIFKDQVHPGVLKFRQKLDVFIIEAASFAELDTLIQMNIQKSIWWNHMASFFVLDLSPGCVNAVDFLGLAWQNDLLNAKILCRHHKSRTIIFNYNPFISQAPIPWKRVKVLPFFQKRKEKTHPFTVFSRDYRENDTVCVNLDFEKTHDLGGYTIRLEGDFRDFMKPPEDIRGRSDHAFETTRNRILATVFHELNATARFYPGGEIGFVSDSNHMSNLLICIRFYPWYRSYARVTYPYIPSEERIVTQFRGHTSQLNKVIDIFDKGSLIGMLVVYLITLMFFKFFARQSLVLAVLNLIRMTAGMGFTNLPGNTASLIYLSSLFLFAIVMQATFQSDTASLLTSQVTLPHPNSIKDLEDLGYKHICAAPFIRDLIVGSAFENKFYGSWEHNYCIIRVKNDSSVAFIDDLQTWTFDAVKKLDLRASTKPIERSYVAFPIHWDYPLTDRINEIIARMIEASVLESWDVKCDPVKLSDLFVDSTDKNLLEFKALNLQVMMFPFAILGIGLLCATLVFIIELAVGYYNVGYTCGIKLRIWCRFMPVARRDSIPTLTELR